MDIKTTHERDNFRKMWEQYVFEFQIFYFDLLVDYLTGVIKQGVYSIEDIVTFNDVLGNYIMLKNLFRAFWNIH